MTPHTLVLDRVGPLLREFDFQTLFTEELGWDHHEEELPIAVEEHTYSLEAVAHKRGLVVFKCLPLEDGEIPPYPVRRKIERKVARTVFEHLIIFVDGNSTTQVWQWVKRQTGRPAACREHSYHVGHTGEALMQKLQGLVFELDEEEHLDVTTVASRVQQSLDVDKVTKRFYDRFKKEHDAFLGFIQGIDNVADCEWYASLMLNRMMFIYFIQKKGFLDDDPDYLRNRLAMMQQKQGKDRFLRFYRYFLLRLFHEGLGQPKKDRTPELEDLLGKVPYLNGGLFDVHELEREYTGIEIPDEAFEKIFDFFDAYTWHLDERPLRADNEINPDVLGYIFEKYVNQKQMGAYYTKEDITGYISRNTVIPYLFDAARKSCSVAFRADGGVWRLLQDDPDRYIYDAVRRGVIDAQGRVVPESALPDFVQEGMHDPRKRMFNNEYNLGRAYIPNPDGYELTLPTETWREYVERRNRCLELRDKLAAGKVQSINDLITYNLDIERFAEDVIVNSEGPELVKAFWKAIENVSILDPTCGSGAFLFAALNILEPLYNACLEGMQGFLDDLDRSERKHHPNKLKPFRDVLAEMEKHPNNRYFVLKSIIINNLYGVDIMEEAVEICKLRMFLKLVAQVESIDEIEPLPDIDFNVRAGNTLVGFTSLDAVRDAMTLITDGKQTQHRMLYPEEEDTLKRIEEGAELAERAFQMFRQMQTQHDMDAEAFSKAKTELRARLNKLRAELDSCLANEYGVPSYGTDAFGEWRASHQPFHWFVEFFGIVATGGFDVCVGNPPYVEYRTVSQTYRVREYTTLPCKNLYAFVLERCLSLLANGSRFGMIIPSSATCTDRYAPLQALLLSQKAVHISSYSDQRGKLFDIAHPRLCIVVYQKGEGPDSVYATHYLKLGTPELRASLFERLSYNDVTAQIRFGVIPRYESKVELSIDQRIFTEELDIGRHVTGAGDHRVYYTRKMSWFVQVTRFIPAIVDKHGKRRRPSELKTLHFPSKALADMAFAALNANLFYWFVTTGSDCRNLNMREVRGYPFDMSRVSDAVQNQLRRMAERLGKDINEKSEMRSMTFENVGALQIQCIFPSRSKGLIDQIDTTLAKHFEFTDEQLDFVVNYDIKYRMGQDLAEAES